MITNRSTESSGTENVLPVDGESLWKTKVEPNVEGSGALLPNPTFSDDDCGVSATSPEYDALFEAFSTPANLDSRDLEFYD